MIKPKYTGMIIIFENFKWLISYDTGPKGEIQ